MARRMLLSCMRCPSVAAPPPLAAGLPPRAADPRASPALVLLLGASARGAGALALGMRARCLAWIRATPRFPGNSACTWPVVRCLWCPRFLRASGWLPSNITPSCLLSGHFLLKWEPFSFSWAAVSAVCVCGCVRLVISILLSCCHPVPGPRYRPSISAASSKAQISVII